MSKGSLFDMDGVLVDTEQLILPSAMSFFREQGVESASGEFTSFAGAGESRYIGEGTKNTG